MRTGGRQRRHAATRRRRQIAFDLAIAIVMLVVFGLKIVNYADPSALQPSAMARTAELAVHNASSAISNLPFLNHCPSGMQMVDVPGGYVCVQGSGDGVYSQIYRTYPLVGRGREAIYSSLDEGSLAAASDLLRNRFDVPRYPPVQLPSLPRWSEDPYSANYWRLEFYSLRPSLNLLYAFRTTGNAVYARKLVALDLSFISAEDRSRWAWADPHAVAFRSMALVDAWWKLRQAHALPEAASSAMLREIEKTGSYLADPNNYQPEDNHGVNESAALYEIGVAFPTLPHAQQWLSLAKQRFRWELDGLIDADGQLIENSPFYNFYSLAKYWEIYKYSLAQGSPVSADYQQKLQSMLHFATYILQPNSQVPLLGASIKARINDHGAFSAMTAADPQFQYVLAHGTRGSVPSRRSVFFRASGLTVMRSGWGSGAAFARSTYLTFNIGKYRTAHSNLDALAVTLYGDGGDLLPGAGLYTYQPGRYRNYFHGTGAHDTVMVDGKSQTQGDGTGSRLVTKDGITYQAAESSLYRGVTHRRLVMMIDAHHLLIVDRLSSPAVHTYQQMFHLFPGASLSRSGLTVSGIGGRPRREVTIQQLLPHGIAESDVINQRGKHPGGLCSQQYGKLLPCYAISYRTQARNAEYMTLITIGKPRQQGFSIRVGPGGQQVRIHDARRSISLWLGESAGRQARVWASHPRPPAVRIIPVQASSGLQNWALSGSGVLSAGVAATDSGHTVTRLSTSSGSPVFMQDNAVALNLVRYNARIRLNVTGLGRLSELRLMLSNDHWAKSVTMNLLDAYTRDFAGGWMNIFAGRSSQWGQNGGWVASAPGFTWSKIDGVRLEMSTRTSGGPPSTVSVDRLSLLPAQREGKLVFVFDDGYQSILPAAQYLHQRGMAGDIAVIGKYVDYPTQDHLNLYQLKTLQNAWGWNMVNHTQQHADAVQEYYSRNDLTGYAADVLQQAAWLEAHGLDSAPNWFIYPHGTTNAELERVIGRYYMFARVVASNPDAYPYGDPHAISDLEIQYPGDGEGGNVGFTPPSEILSAVRQAISDHMTLILTFHRIHSEASDPPGYPLRLFRQIVDGIARSRIKVMTFSQLDRSNGVPLTNRISYVAAQPSQITVRMTG